MSDRNCGRKLTFWSEIDFVFTLYNLLWFIFSNIMYNYGNPVLVFNS